MTQRLPKIDVENRFVWSSHLSMFLTSAKRERERWLDSPGIKSSVTRFDEISPVWIILKSLWQFLEDLFSIWSNFEPTLTKNLCYWANFHCFKWSNIQKYLAIWSHWHQQKRINRAQISRACVFSLFEISIFAKDWTWGSFDDKCFWTNQEPMALTHFRLAYLAVLQLSTQSG